MYGRELLITLAQAVFDKKQNTPLLMGQILERADSKRMLDAYIHYCMHKKSKEREVKFAKAAVDFSNELTHNRTATAMDAESYVIMRFYLLFISSAPCTNTMIKKELPDFRKSGSSLSLE